MRQNQQKAIIQWDEIQQEAYQAKLHKENMGYRKGITDWVVLGLIAMAL